MARKTIVRAERQRICSGVMRQKANAQTRPKYTDLTDYSNAQICSQELNNFYGTDMYKCEDDPDIFFPDFAPPNKLLDALRDVGVNAKLWSKAHAPAGEFISNIAVDAVSVFTFLSGIFAGTDGIRQGA